MAQTITIKGDNIMEETAKAEVLQWLSNNATLQELQKIKKLAQNPAMRAMLKTV
jgi:hypothetical protein